MLRPVKPAIAKPKTEDGKPGTLAGLFFACQPLFRVVNTRPPVVK